MRKVAAITKTGSKMKRAMLYGCDDGVCLFLYDYIGDGPCEEDHFFQTFDAAEEAAAETYGISRDAWQTIPDPPPGCQHDWIAPTRLKRDESGKKLFGQFESAS